MEELFLSAFLLRQKLNVIDQQDVDVAEFVAEAGHLVITQRVDHFIGEFLAGDIANCSLRHCALDLMPNSLHEMGLAHSHSAVQEERVVSLRWTLRHCLARRMRELVTAPDHERVKRIARIELRCAIPVET